MKTNQFSSFSNKDLLEDFFKNSSQLELKHEIMKQGENPILSWLKHAGYTLPHKYIIYKDSQAIGLITEQISSKIWFFISHIILKSHRPLHFILQDNKRNPLLIFHRPFYFWLSQLHTKDVRGKDIGRVQQKFSITHKKISSVYQPYSSFWIHKIFLDKVLDFSRFKLTKTVHRRNKEKVGRSYERDFNRS